MPLVQDFLHPYARLATTNRLIVYGLFSTLAVSLVILNAFKSYSNFYSVAVYLSRSNRSVMVLANFAVLWALLIGRGLQHVFFGALRANEVERLYDRIWFFLTESLLAFTIFRDEFDVSFCVMFGFLLFVKCFHWLMSFRIEWMDQVQFPGPNVWFHVRMNALFVFLWCMDTLMLCFAIESLLTHGMGGVVLFASEYAILMASALNSMSKYFIIFYDIRRAAARGGDNAPVWEDKSMFIFYVELVTDFLKLITYLTFFLLVLTFYGLPLNIVRDVYLTARSFINRCRDLVRYRTATRNMDERYPNATEEELTQMNDRTCIICREEMVFRNLAAQPAAGQAAVGVNDTPKKLPCGHVFHFHCLRSWLERQQSCPTCRRTVLETRQPQNPDAGLPQVPPQPQPGGIPQLPNFGGPAVAQQQPQLGFFARWLGGVAAAPPVVPGQFAPGPGFFNQQQGPFINQQPPQQGFPPQNPFGPWQQPGYYVPAQQGPAPVQVLQGFYIGNQWQPWGVPIQGQQPRAQIRVQAQAPPPAPGTAPQPRANSRPPTPTHTSPSPEDNAPVRPPQPSRRASIEVSSRGGESTATPESSAQNVTNPRDAAGLAALRRLSSRNAPLLPSSTTSDSTSKAGQTGRSTQISVSPPPLPNATVRDPLLNATTSASRGPVPITPTSSSPSLSSPRSSASSTSSASRSSRTPVPSLIPLFDPATTSATIVPPPPFHRASNTAPSSHQFHPNAYTPPFSPQHSQTRPRPRLSDPNTLVSELMMRAQNALPDIRSLPQTLTEEQLNRLDTLTREAIDERLRALENVQGAMWRCVEELVRVRSALPTRPPAAGVGVQHRENTTGGEDVNDKGKGKGLVPEDGPEAATENLPGPISDPVTPTGVQVEPPEGEGNVITGIGEISGNSVHGNL